MFKHSLNMKLELIKNVGSWGNSAGILLPKEWIGNQVKVILLDRTNEIKKEIFNILDNYLDKILGIYLVGSYARGEQNSESDIDILVISDGIKKEIKSGKYNISIFPIKNLKSTILIQPELILPMISEARVILNPLLLKEFEVKLDKKSFKKFYKDSIEILKINKEFIQLDKENNKTLKSKSVIYSLILRLRGLFFIKCLLNDKKYSKKVFEKWISSVLTKKEFNECYKVYQLEKENKSSKNLNIKIETIEKLAKFFEKELEYLK